jgi:hypothetical protein
MTIAKSVGLGSGAARALLLLMGFVLRASSVSA